MAGMAKDPELPPVTFEQLASSTGAVSPSATIAVSDPDTGRLRHVRQLTFKPLRGMGGLGTMILDLRPTPPEERKASDNELIVTITGSLQTAFQAGAKRKMETDLRVLAENLLAELRKSGGV